MKNKLLIYLFTFIAIFSLASCNRNESINTEEALSILKSCQTTSNVMIKTNTKKNSNLAYQEDIYYEDKYFHSSNSNNTLIKTWYGYIDNTLYAFYYKRSQDNEENKNSARIDVSLLSSTKSQPNYLINCFFDENDRLLSDYNITGFKYNNIYTINVTNTNDKNNYKFTIKDNKLKTIVNTINEVKDFIVTYEYSYDIEDITLPNIEEYPLKVNN